MVIKSSGIFIKPMMPKIKIEGKMLGIIARIDKLNDLKINKNRSNYVGKKTLQIDPLTLRGDGYVFSHDHNLVFKCYQQSLLKLQNQNSTLSTI
jgi:hypothetical protein